MSALVSVQHRSEAGRRAQQQREEGRSFPLRSESAGPPPVPPLLYQLLKGGGPKNSPLASQQAPSASSSHGVSQRATKVPRAHAEPPPTRRKSKPAPDAPATAAPPLFVASSRPTRIDAASQYAVADLSLDADEGAACGHCACCAVASGSAAHATARQAQLLAQNRALEERVAELVTKVRTLRTELTNATTKSAADEEPPTSGSVHSSRAMRRLEEQHAADQREIQRLRAQMIELQLRVPVQHTGTTDRSLLDVQRHQLELRTAAESTLARLQQLFPERNFG